MNKAGVRVPLGLVTKENVLVMELIGENGVPAKPLKETPAKEVDYEYTYKKIIEFIARNLYLEDVRINFQDETQKIDSVRLEKIEISLKNIIIDDLKFRIKLDEFIILFFDLDKINIRGVFYPLQTFSKVAERDFSNVPICIETCNKNWRNLLKQLAEDIGSKSYRVNSKQRSSLYLAAVFVNNFNNQLFRIAHEIT